MNHKRKNNKRERTKFIYTGIWGFKKSFKKDYEDKKAFKLVSSKASFRETLM